MINKTKMNRQSILERPEFSHIKEALQTSALAKGTDIWQPIRETPLSVFFSKDNNSFQEERPNQMIQWLDLLSTLPLEQCLFL